MKIEFLDKLSLRMKTIFMLALPVLGMIWLAILVVVSTMERHDNAVLLDKLVIVVDKSVKVLPLLQTERGMSATFISSEGESFRTRLGVQRRKVDAAVERLMEEARVIGLDFLPAEKKKVFEGLVSDLSRLQDLRIRVDNLSLTPFDAILELAQVQVRTDLSGKMLASIGFGGLRDAFYRVRDTQSEAAMSAFLSKHSAAINALDKLRQLGNLSAQHSEDLDRVGQLLVA